MRIVGINVKRIREEKNLTLRQLADRLSVSASFLSQIETGKTYPSLQNLKRLADSLDTSVSRLVGDGHLTEDNPVVRENERKVMTPFGKDIQVSLLYEPDAFKQMEPMLFTLKENASIKNVRHQHFGQEFAFVFKGSIEITLAEKKFIIRKGDSIYFNSSVPHFFRNVAKGESVVLWITTPPPG